MVTGFPIEKMVVMIVVAVIAATDMWKFKVYNVLTLPLLCSGFLYHGLYGSSNDLTLSPRRDG